MNLWVSLYIAGQLAYSLGPLPYSMDECNRRVARALSTVTIMPQGHPPQPARLVCHWSRWAPARQKVAQR